MSSSHTFDDMPDWDAIARYRAGESTPDEMAVIADWLRTHPEEAALLDALEGATLAQLARMPLSPDAIDTEGALAHMHQRIAPRVHRAWWAAAGLAAAAAIGFAALSLRPERALAPAHSKSVARSRLPARELSTRIGMRDSLLLSDGTRVMLAPASRLVVSPSYGEGARQVTLDGMATFVVQHDSASPFEVRTAHAVIRDVGTEFVVRTPTSDRAGNVSVAVIEGEVTMAASSSERNATSLRAGDRGEVQPNGNVIVSHGTAGDADVAWTRGVLLYSAAPLDLVRDDLRRWYGVELRVPDSALSSRRITATFEGKSVDDVLNTLALALGAEVQRAGNVATLRHLAKTR